MNNSFIFKGIIDSSSLFDFKKEIDNVNSGTEIVINSTGGDLDCAFSMLDLINSSKHQINTTILGKCYSAAIVPFLAGKTRKMYNHSTVLIHEPYLMFPDDVQFNLTDLAREYEKLYLKQQRFIKLFTEKTKLTEKKLKKMFESGDTILTAKDCLKFGIATKII